MKKKITAIILAVIMLLSTIGTFTSTAAEPVYSSDRYNAENTKLLGMEKKLDNGKLELYINETTAEVAIKNKKTGEIILSNPTDPIADEYRSQLIVYYKKTASDEVDQSYGSYKDCIGLDDPQVEFEYTSDKVVIKYTLGEDLSFKYLPRALSQAEYEYLIGEMMRACPDEYEYDFVSYFKYNEKLGYWELKTKNKNNMRKAERCCIEAGYTVERKLAHYDEIGYVPEDETETASFTIGLEYRLEDESFVAEIDASKISYNRESFILTKVAVLPYMNAANYNEAGYNFIPDGSGALVRYEDVASQNSTNNMESSLYGTDRVYYSVTQRIQEQAIMPVFGQVLHELPYDSGFFAIIESGDAVASVLSSHNASYHSVYAVFRMSANDMRTGVSLGSQKGNLGFKSNEIFKDKCTVKYTMLIPEALQEAENVSGYDATYIGMAALYRDYLTDNGKIEKMSSEEVAKKTKLFLEVFGSMKVEKRYATIPITVNDSLTSFDQVMLIQDELSEAGIGPMNFILTGFANEGLSTKYPTKIKWLRSVGGKAGFEKLLLDAEAKGYEVSPNFDFAYSTYLYGNDNIKYRDHGAKSLDNRFAMKLIYDPGLQVLDMVGGISISSGSYDYAYEKFAKSAVKYDMKNVAVLTLGSDLNSDYNEKNFHFRTDSLDNTVELLAKLNGKVESSTQYKLLVEKGNAYTYEYISYITDTPLDSSRLRNASEAVPFTGMVLHGSIVYTGGALNMEGDDEYLFLKSLENGANLYFTIAYENVEYLKLDWHFNEYFSVSYDLWKDYIIERYAEYNKVMESKQDSYIVDHDFLNSSEFNVDGNTVYRLYEDSEELGMVENSKVVRVEYENGEGFFINYNSEFSVEITYQGRRYEVSPMSYTTYKDRS